MAGNRHRLSAPWRVAAGAAVVAVTLVGVSAARDPGERVHEAQAAVMAPGVNRVYYIAADTVDWNYAPSGTNLITGEAFGDTENVFVANGPDRIGSTYTKSLYREYTDGTFTKLKAVPAKWRHLGTLGPLIRAVVGDTIEVHFKNNTPFPASVHPHNVLYAKSSEGAPYADGTSGADKADDAVATGDSVTYNWQVPERAGPASGDGSSVMSMYHSHTDEVGDTYAGLVGPMIITRRGMARPDGSPMDVDRELVTMFEVSDENQSPYLDANIAKFATAPETVDPASEAFGESNLMHSINGYVYGNIPGLDMRKGQKVRWYMIGMGTEVDIHTPHWHGNTLTSMGMRTDMTSLLPGMMMTADMNPDNAGTWLFHCHVNDHITAGMTATYTVRP